MDSGSEGSEAMTGTLSSPRSGERMMPDADSRDEPVGAAGSDEVIKG